jgi:putative transposase
VSPPLDIGASGETGERVPVHRGGEGRGAQRESACAVLEVSRAAYYEWRQQQPSQRAREDQELTEKVKAIFRRSRQTYGAPRMHRELRRQDVRCSRKRVARIMREQALQGRYPKRWQKTTIPDPDPDPPAGNLIERRFQPQDRGLNTCWAGDITYIRTWEGWMYLATVIDLASRRVVTGRWPSTCVPSWSVRPWLWQSAGAGRGQG